MVLRRRSSTHTRNPLTTPARSAERAWRRRSREPDRRAGSSAVRVTRTRRPAQRSSPSSPAPSIAQNWLDLSAERGPSTFDQRHLLTFQMQYTSGEGIRGGALLSGWRGTLFKEWTFTPQLTAGSGLPETPVYLTNVAGTGVTGTIRPNLHGRSVNAAPAGFFLNPAAYTAPAPGPVGRCRPRLDYRSRAVRAECLDRPHVPIGQPA